MEQQAKNKKKATTTIKRHDTTSMDKRNTEIEADLHKRNGRTGECTREKTVVVIKRRRPQLKQGFQTCTTVSRGIPARTFVADSATVAQDKQNDNGFEPNLDDNGMVDLPSDAWLVIQALQNNPETSILIPLLHSPHHEQTAPYLKAVLECQVHNRLRDSSTCSELQDLFDSKDINGSLIQLRAPSQDGVEEVLSVLLATHDYIRGVRDAHERYRVKKTTDSSVFNETTKVLDWFVQHLRDWTGRYIREADVEESFRRDPLVGIRGPKRVMELLQIIQVVLPSHELHAYQLWLPEWGTVLKAWQDSRGKLLAKIKRSYYGEKSLQSLKQSTGPIPVELMIEWLKEVGVVHSVNRPSGIFIRLCKHN
jgi:hypothetical protein